MIEHRYIKLYGSQEEWQEALDNHELEEVAVAAVTEDREDTPDEYQYSVRETNNDNERKGKFNSSDNINYFGGLEIIWGYWGWQWSDIEYDGETLHGGQFIDVKNTTKYPDILDGYRLQHINNLTLLTPNVSLIGYFNAENVVSAANAFKSTVKNIKTGSYPNVRNCTNMFHTLSKSVVGDTLYIPNVQEGPVVFNTLRLEQPFKIHLNSTPVDIYSGTTDVYVEGGVNFFDYFDGIDELYDLSHFYLSHLKVHEKDSDLFIFSPVYEGEETVILPTLYLSSSSPKDSIKYKLKLQIDKPVKAESVMFFGYNRQFFEKAEVPDNLFTELIVPDDYDVFHNCNFSEDYPAVVFNNITYGEVYSNCNFSNQPITFDCTLLKEYELDHEVKPFNTCQGVSLTLNNIPQGSNIIFNPRLTGFNEVNLNFDNESTFKLLGVSAKTTVQNKVFNVKDYTANINLEGCTVNWIPEGEKFSGPNITSTVNNCVLNLHKCIGMILLDIHNTQINLTDMTVNKSSTNSISLGEHNDEGDFSDITIDIKNVQKAFTLSIVGKEMVKSPVIKSTVIDSVISISLPSTSEVLNATEFHTSSSGGFNLLFSGNKNIRELHFGDGLISVNIDMAQNLDISSFIQSVGRQTGNRTRSININRIPWDNMTDVQREIITAMFEHITITENLEDE